MLVKGLLASDYTWGVPVLGGNKDGGTEWSDESCALIHGRVTGVRVWVSGNRFTL